jgi:hypothetical protein
MADPQQSPLKLRILLIVSVIPDFKSINRPTGKKPIVDRMQFDDLFMNGQSQSNIVPVCKLAMRQWQPVIAARKLKKQTRVIHYNPFLSNN